MTKEHPEESVEDILRMLRYDPATGLVTRPGKAGRSVCSGELARKNGYLFMSVSGRRYAVHRLAWLCAHGSWPKGQIDHINGVRDDNRAANLRDVTASVNRENQRAARSDNLSSGVLGVHWSEYHGKWKAHIRVAGKLMHLKYCATKDEAFAVYLQAKRALHAGCTI